MRRIAKSEAREKRRLNKFLESDDEYENLDFSELAEGAHNPSLLSPEKELKEQLEQGMNKLECERSLVRKDAKDKARSSLKQELDERKMPSASINGNGSIIGNGNTINNFFNVTAPGARTIILPVPTITLFSSSRHVSATSIDDAFTTIPSGVDHAFATIVIVNASSHVSSANQLCCKFTRITIT
jgi:hypothetical protein